MARLTVPQVKNAKPGRHGDGDGLFLIVGELGGKSWVLRMQRNGKRRDFGLGSARDVTLAEAREAAAETRKLVLKGFDPVAEKKKASGIPTFREVAKAVHKEYAPGWKNRKHAAQWLTTLRTYAFPDIGNHLVNDITSGDVRDVLAKIWLEKPETARRLRQRITTVLDYAHAKGWRDSETPTGAISKGLPKQPRATGHHAAMAWKEVPAFVANMADKIKAGEVVLLAIEFALLNASRPAEVRFSTWSEIDFEARLWTIPAGRMKAGKAHRVPLSDRSMAILDRMTKLRRTRNNDGLIFEGAKRGKPLSENTLTKPFRDAGIPATVHGFRSSFRDWCSDAGGVPREVAEACLAHEVASETEAAYARTDHLDRRREVMERWADYVGERVEN